MLTGFSDAAIIGISDIRNCYYQWLCLEQYPFHHNVQIDVDLFINSVMSLGLSVHLLTSS